MSLGLAVTEPVGLISQLGMFAIESVFYLVFVRPVTQLGLSAIEPVSNVNMSATDPVCQAGLAAVEPIEAIELISQLGRLLTIESVFQLVIAGYFSQLSLSPVEPVYYGGLSTVPV